MWELVRLRQGRARGAGGGRALDLLKTTYRLESQAEPKLYEIANGRAGRLGLSCTVTLSGADRSGAKCRARLSSWSCPCDPVWTACRSPCRERIAGRAGP